MSTAAVVAPMPQGFSHLAYTNKVYTNVEFNMDTELVRIGEHIFASAKLPALPGATDIALNALQRESCGVSQGQDIRFTPVLVRDVPDAYMVRLKLDLIVKRKAEIKEDELIAAFLKLYQDLPVSVDGVWCMDFGGTPVKMTFTSVAAIETAAADNTRSGVSKTVPAGMLTKSTSVEVLPNTDNRLLVFEPSATRKKTRMFDPNFSFDDMGVGGLDAEFATIFRRAFASRLLPPQFSKKMGVAPVKGMLLYGPPGTGKTLIARQIGKMLAGREPKIVRGPEILNKFVGQAEENIRNLFADAIADYAENKENADLHIIIFDEIDSICKARGSVRSGTGVHDNVVNQLLTMIDGVDSPNNILVIGMTNRKDLLDPALTRPGRLEIQIEISLPDEPGRRQILGIHTRKLRESGMLDPDVDLDYVAKHTKNYSGAELEGVVKAAASNAISAVVEFQNGLPSVKDNFESMRVNMAHFEVALEDVKPAFGVAENDMELMVGPAFDDGIETFKDLTREAGQLINVLRDDPELSASTLLLHGAPGSGTSALAARFAKTSGFPFVKIIAPRQFVGLHESAKASEISMVFEQAYKSPLSVIVIDDLEGLVEWASIGCRYSNAVLQGLRTVLKQPHPEQARGRKLLVIATTSDYHVISELKLNAAFDNVLEVPLVNASDAAHFLQRRNVVTFDRVDAEGATQPPNRLPLFLNSVGTESTPSMYNVPIKSLLMAGRNARHSNGKKPFRVGHPVGGETSSADAKSDEQKLSTVLRMWLARAGVSDAKELARDISAAYYKV